MLLPIELNKTAKFTGTSLTSAFRNAARWGYGVGRVARVAKRGQTTMEPQHSELSRKSSIVFLVQQLKQEVTKINISGKICHCEYFREGQISKQMKNIYVRIENPTKDCALLGQNI